MTAAADRLAGIFARGINNDEGFAHELAAVSEILRQDAHPTSAEGMLRFSRHHRIRGMEGRGKLVTLQDHAGHAEDVQFLVGETSRPDGG